MKGGGPPGGIWTGHPPPWPRLPAALIDLFFSSITVEVIVVCPATPGGNWTGPTPWPAAHRGHKNIDALKICVSLPCNHRTTALFFLVPKKLGTLKTAMLL